MAASGYGVTLLERDPPRRRHRAAPMGDGRHVVLLVHHPPAHHRPRLRLAAARRLLLLRARGARWPGCVSASVPVREALRAGVALACCGRPGRVDRAPQGAGVSGQQEEFDRRSERVAAMTGIERTVAAAAERVAGRPTRPAEFPPVLDLVPVVDRLDRTVRGGARRRRQHRRRRSSARSSARRSSARSPTRCCSATGTSCSRACRAGCSTRWSPRCRCSGRWS